ncbi:PREDICTED: uncharacterized protein LOC108559197 [Nicrophorus vespilloides]|uniref:Uncharacterized protein LOC108559197 n=1 Tax=Nicrophorus vespilloides TaxID=110193 RepID=A0ABM1MBC0_NICVS|nr:PREDICTED: uncharacterized protein LOC108559197 [Nicrophorus vespilloides]XP_017771868.1 PREDICTED: uncharacterized protein LOC108559197 [Nicrophorus vespilloides]XP_017771869.1 PREDICTED: uncharacterized protein LOC108559197 [Nicrophorus vespilloides]XP_017771870.1 PREDICTED: uncharacterized protein LOC108559197 [Nicrophorus vespilloides]
MFLIILMFCCLMTANCKPSDNPSFTNVVATQQTPNHYAGRLKLIHVFFPTKEPLFRQYWQRYKGDMITRRKRSVDGDATIQDPYKNVVMVDDINNRNSTDKKKSPIDNFYNMNVEMVAAEDIPFPPLFQYRLKQKRRNERFLERQKDQYRKEQGW